MKYIELNREEMLVLNGGGWKEAAFKILHYGFKYSSLSGAVITGIVEGYVKESQK